jgi:hypothetical protein
VFVVGPAPAPISSIPVFAPAPVIAAPAPVSNSPAVDAPSGVGGGLDSLAPAPSPRGESVASVPDKGSASDNGNGKGNASTEIKPIAPSATAIVANSAAIGAATSAGTKGGFGANGAANNAAQLAGDAAGQANTGNTAAVVVHGPTTVDVNGNPVGSAADNTFDLIDGADVGLGALRVQAPQTVAQSRSAQRVGGDLDDARLTPLAAAASVAAQVDLVEATQATGLALTAGTVWWALRAGGLLAGLVVTLPAWRHADLLAVLPDAEDEENWDPADGGEVADDEAARDERAVRQMLEPVAERELT